MGQTRSGALRRGLPRVPGGEPWPPTATEEVDVTPATASAAAPIQRDAAPVAVAETPDAPPPVTGTPLVTSSAEAGTSPVPPPAAGPTGRRRGLPRVAHGDPWPPAASGSTVPATGPSAPKRAPAAEAETVTAAPQVAASVAVAGSEGAPRRTGLQRQDPSRTPTATAAEPPAAARVAPAAPREHTAPDVPPMSKAAPASAGRRLQALSRPVQIVLGLIALLVAAAVVVLAARGLTTYEPVQDFLATYPGEYHLPDTVASGFPVWLNWSHFLNAFFIVLIIRSGWQVRIQERPTAFWTNRWSKNPRKISLTLWFHQSLDILWLLNGIVFVILIFATGHWLRIVPSSWEVFPNALSALLRYLTLEWPVENGWVNYNSLQQLMYFIVVFIAAPLAALTGVRMSGVWPKNAKRLSAIYPVEWARAIHFPVMLFFVFFVIVHVFLVLATGALRNLNHMYASSDEVNWIGFGIFFASLVVTAAAWIAARPLVIAPIASLFGRVASR